MTPTQLLDLYDRGALTRRHLLTALAGAFVAGPAIAESTDEPTFRATGLDHIALRVSDVERSRAFYERHLGLETTSASPSQAFLSCGSDFVALFRGDRPGLDHYSYALPDYSQRDAADRLRDAGLEPKLRGNRTYFDDPDGIEVQVSRG